MMMNIGVSGMSGMSGMVDGGGESCTPSINRSRVTDGVSYFSGGDVLSMEGVSQFCLGCWVKMPLPPSAGGIMGKWGNAARREYLLYHPPNGGVYMIALDEDTADYGEAGHPALVSSETWHFVYGHLDNGELLVQFDDDTPVTAAFTGSIRTRTEPFTIANWGAGAGLMAASIQQAFVIPGSILTVPERAELYNSGAGADYRTLSSGLVSKFESGSVWPLNEESGDAIASEGAIDLADVSGVGSGDGLFLSC